MCEDHFLYLNVSMSIDRETKTRAWGLKFLLFNALFISLTDEMYVGKVALVTGWGTLKEDGKPSCTLQQVEVPVLSNDDCTSKTNYTQKMITNNMLCAGYPGVGKKDSCQGDSGKTVKITGMCMCVCCSVIYCLGEKRNNCPQSAIKFKFIRFKLKFTFLR